MSEQHFGRVFPSSHTHKNKAKKGSGEEEGGRRILGTKVKEQEKLTSRRQEIRRQESGILLGMTDSFS